MINPKSFEYDESRWADVFNHLKSKGFEVHSPMTKVGECTSPYIVIRMGASARFSEFSSDQDVYELMLYVPKLQYSKLEPMIQSVRAAMNELEPMFKSAHNGTASYFDETVQGHMVSLDYHNVKKC